jgi:hypothetical protein
MHGSYTNTCETSSNCNLYVSMVLHNRVETSDGTQYICDIWRAWSPPHVKGAAVHHRMLHDIAVHYGQPLQGGVKPLVEDLKRMIVYTDGHPGVYKAYPNVGPLSYWSLNPESEPYPNGDQGYKHAHGIEVVHVTFESHHASGPVDQAGKVLFSVNPKESKLSPSPPPSPSPSRPPSPNHPHSGTPVEDRASNQP